jgi:hypothetical protein
MFSTQGRLRGDFHIRALLHGCISTAPDSERTEDKPKGEAA